MKSYRTIALTVVVLLVASAVWAGDEKKDEKDKKKSEQYSAVVLGVSGRMGGASSFLTIWINEYTSDAEMKEHAALLKAKGQDELEKKLEKLDRGRVALTGITGVNLAIARSIPNPKGGRILRLVTDRRMSFPELRYSGRSTDYPFTIIELTVDDQGKGSGAVIGAAKVKFNKQNVLEIESFGMQALKVVNVKREK